jgi:hypothetical protein
MTSKELTVLLKALTMECLSGYLEGDMGFLGSRRVGVRL